MIPPQGITWRWSLNACRIGYFTDLGELGECEINRIRLFYVWNTGIKNVVIYSVYKCDGRAYLSDVRTRRTSGSAVRLEKWRNAWAKSNITKIRKKRNKKPNKNCHQNTSVTKITGVTAVAATNRVWESVTTPRRWFFGPLSKVRLRDTSKNRRFDSIRLTSVFPRDF